MQRHHLARFSFLVSVSAVPAASGCAHATQDGGANVYTNGPLIYYGIVAVGLGFIGFGLYAIWLGIVEQTERGIANFRRESVKAFGYTKPHPAVWKSGLTIILGMTCILAGSAITVILPAKSQVDRMEVYDDRFVIRKARMFDDGQDRTIRYANIASITHDKPLIKTKRSKEYFVVNLTNGESETFKVTAIERAAFPKIIEKLELFRSNGFTGQVDARPAAPPPVATPSDDLVMVVPDSNQPRKSPQATAPTSLGRRHGSARPRKPHSLQPQTPPGSATERQTQHASAASADESTRDDAAGLQPRQVRRRPITIPLPDGASVVQDDTPLVPGTRLGAVWASKWNFVTVMEVHDDGTVKVKWDGWNSVYDMTREDLAITADVLAEMEFHGQIEQPTERLWSDASGKFQITATYVDSRTGYVRLRKPDGTEVSVALKKLSRDDRRLVAQLARKR